MTPKNRIRGRGVENDPKNQTSFMHNPLQDLLSSMNAVILTNESIQFIPGHMVYNLAYISILQKTTIMACFQSSFEHIDYLFSIKSTPFAFLLAIWHPTLQFCPSSI
jgi:hypothetical protein